MTTIVLKKGTGTPATTDLAAAELAIDTSNGTIYSKLDSGTVTALNTADFIGANPDADNYQYWRYKVDGFSTTNVLSTSDVDFQSGSNITLSKEGFGIKFALNDNVTITGSLSANSVTASSGTINGDLTVTGDLLDGAGDPIGGGGGIADGDTAGQVTTWSGTEWTPDASLTIDATGNATFSGSVKVDKTAPSVGIYSNGTEAGYVGTTLWNTGTGSDTEMSIRGKTGITFVNDTTVMATFAGGNATFSGTVSATSFFNQGGGGIIPGGNTVSPALLPTDNTGTLSHEKMNIGNNANKWKDGYFSGMISAASFVGDGSGLTNLPSSGMTQAQGDARYVLKSGNSTVSGTITATDFIATSDRRVKKNIATAPTGVLEKIRGVEFEWKSTGQMGSGVIAQELEEVPELAHLVHYGEEDGTKHVSYLGLIGYLIEEVKSLRAEIEELK